MSKVVIIPDKNPPLNATYNQAVKVGDVLYVSGQIGFDPQAKVLVEGGIGPETRQCLENIRTIIEAAGGTMSDIVKMTVFVSDVDLFAGMNAVYSEYFTGVDAPTKTAVAVGGLALGASVEMDAVANIG